MSPAAKALCCRCCFLMVVVVVVVFVVATEATMGGHHNAAVAAPNNPELRSVCVGDRDIRNSPANLKRELKGCVVVEGFLQVVLIENTKQEDFAGLSFPELREVTGYVVFYQVNGLLSLGQLFPNLTLIRGDELFLQKYALVVYGLPQLVELGLTALQLIMRGSVRVKSNPDLCLAESLDWGVLAPLGSENHFSLNNDNCQPCNCASGLCWGYGACRVPTRMKAPGGRECHRDCAVGCTGTTNMDCLACTGPEIKGRCITKCPPDLLLFRGRRCVTTEWCVEQHPSAGGHSYAGGIILSTNSSMAPKTCVSECPSGFFEVKELVAKTKRIRRRCEPCRGSCKKVCDPASVRTVANARNLKGCTTVKGSLEIEIHTGSTEEVERELTSSLGQIQIIEGSLVISRSRPLTSLHFFRSLRLINNKDPGRRVAIFVNDNVNLQYLFDWGEGSKTTSLALGNGSKEASFFYNPRLCPEEIDKFAKGANVVEMFNSYNGFTNACGNRPHMSSYVSRLESESVVLTWQPASEVMEYAIFVARAAGRNVTDYSGSAQCDDSDPGNVPGDASLDGWAVLDVRFDKGNGEVSQVVPRLQPATLYAYYIKTYTKDSKVNSPIKYFRTKPDRPTPPASATAMAVRPTSSEATAASSALLVAWEPPPRPNGRLSHYIVVGELRDDDDRRQLGDKDFCEQPLTGGRAVSTNESLTADAARRWLQGKEVPRSAHEPADGCCCVDCCSVPLDEDQCERLLRGTGDVLDACGRPVISLDRCAHVLYSVVADNLRMADSDQNFPKTAKPRDSTLDITEQWDTDGVGKRRFVRIESAPASSTLVESLVPFGLYSISVHACGHKDDDDARDGTAPLTSFCGTAALTAARTLPAPDADQPVAANASLQADVLHVNWTEPPHPNGMVVAYHVRYRDRHRFEGGYKCVTRQTHRDQGGSVQMLIKSMFPEPSAHNSVPDSNVDRYVVQVRAVSLAGPGAWVDVKIRTAAGGRSSSSSPTSATTEDAASSGALATAAIVVAAVLLLLALLAAALYVLRRRGAAADADSGRQRLVNPDLTDCWDIPDLPDADPMEARPARPAANRVRYHRRAEAVSVPTSVSVSTASARTLARSREAHANGDWHWVTWPSDPDVHHSSLPPSPERNDAAASASAVDTRMPPCDYSGWHPTNPFHPDNISRRSSGALRLSTRNPFQGNSTENEEFLTFVGDPNVEQSTPGRRVEITAGKASPVDEDEDKSTTDEMHKSCSTDSFISVNLNGSEQAAGQIPLQKSINNKHQQ